MESSTAFSPDHEIAVSGENGEAKGPPMRGCFAPQRRINLSSVNQRDCVPTRAGATCTIVSCEGGLFDERAGAAMWYHHHSDVGNRYDGHFDGT